MIVLLLVAFGVSVAYAFPEPVKGVAPLLQPSFAVTMFFVGTLVPREHLERLREAPARPFIGLATQYAIMPIAAFLISLGFDDPAIRAGIVLTGCMPGAMASNVMTALLRGDLVLSVLMTTLATLLAPLILALWLPLLLGRAIPLSPTALAWDAAWMVAIPVAIGIVARHWMPRIPAWWDSLATGIAAAAITLIVMVVVAANAGRIATIGMPVALAMLALNLAGYAGAYLAGRALDWPPAQRRTLVVEVGMQNAGLGSVLALAHLGEAGAVPSAFYTALCVVTAALALPIAERLRAKE